MIPRARLRRGGVSPAIWRTAFAFLLWVAGVPCAAAAEIVADLEIVLAVDASGSVDEDEFLLQLQGIAASFRDPEVLRAIAGGPAGRIAANMVLWAEHSVPKEMTGWFVIASRSDAERFAEVVAGFPRNVTGATGMGEGLAAALRSLEGNGIRSPRQVVDISGDGAESPAREYVVMMPQARTMAYSRGVTVNGLAIVGSEPGLEQWYADHVLAGRGSFLEIARGYSDFATAMRRKLLQEIERVPRVSLRYSFPRRGAESVITKLTVIPAKAGIPLASGAAARRKRDPCFRKGDERRGDDYN